MASVGQGGYLSPMAAFAAAQMQHMATINGLPGAPLTPTSGKNGERPKILGFSDRTNSRLWTSPHQSKDLFAPLELTLLCSVAVSLSGSFILDSKQTALLFIHYFSIYGVDFKHLVSWSTDPQHKFSLFHVSEENNNSLAYWQGLRWIRVINDSQRCTSSCCAYRLSNQVFHFLPHSNSS